MHVFKRFYLLGALVAAAVIPAIVFTSYIEVDPIPMELLILEEPTRLPAVANTTTTADPISWWPLALWSSYGLGVFIFGFKFCRNLFIIWSRIRKNPKYKNNLITHVLLQKLISPHTFFNYLFLNKLKYELQEIPKEVFWHEEVHARQKHSLDILLIEFLQVILWFNPLIYVLKNAIKLNHEFLADQAVLEKGIDLSAYQKTLLNFSATPSAMPLANAINYSSIKKRFQLMKTNTSKRSALVRSLILLPLVAVLIYSFSEKMVLEKELHPETATLTLPQQTAAQKHAEEGASPAMMKMYQDFMARLDQKKMVIHYPEYKKIVAIYHIMTAAQRASITKYPENPIGNLAKIQRKSPNKAQLEAWKDQTKYAIWIDGKLVDNSALTAYSPSDFSYFTSSFVYKNARSKRFPQSYQNHLYTEKGFDKTYLQADSDEYKSLFKKYSAILEKSKGSDEALPLELDILRAQLRWLYHNFSPQEKETYTIPPLPESPKGTSAPTPKQIAAYDAWSKKMHATPMNRRIIKIKDWNTMSAIYNAMSLEQKQKVNALPTVPPPPRPEIVGVSQIQDKLGEYKKKLANYELVRNEKTHYVHKSEKAQNEMDKLHSELGGMFFRLSKADKRKTERPINPRHPYVILIKDGKKTYKKKSELTAADKALLPPPPPPAPPALKVSKNQVIEIKEVEEIEEKEEVEEIEEIEEIEEKEEVEKIEGIEEIEEIEEIEDVGIFKVVHQVQQQDYTNTILIEVDEDPKKTQEKGYSQVQKFHLYEYIQDKNEKETVYKEIPFPKSPTSYILKKEKQGAIFYDKWRKISAKEAVALVKKSKQLYITTTKSLSSPTYSVYLSKQKKLIGIKGKKTASTYSSPPSLLEYSRELAAQKAQFYYQNKKISSKEGLKIIETYKEIEVETYPYVSKQPEVKIYKKS